MSPVSFSKQPSNKLNSFHCGGTQTQKTTWCSSSMRWFIGKASMKWGHIAIVIIYPTSEPNRRLLHAWQITSNCAFFVLPPSQSIIIALNVFSPKKHYLLAKYYRVLLWGTRSFVPVTRLEIRNILVFQVTKIGIALQLKYFLLLKNPFIFTP